MFPIACTSRGSKGSAKRATVLSRDAFTAPDGTDLAVHTPDVGPAWTVVRGEFSIESNHLQCTGIDGTTSDALAVVDLGQADFTLDVDVPQSADGNSATASNQLVQFRRIDNANFWYAYVQPNSGGDQLLFSLYKRVNGATDGSNDVQVADGSVAGSAGDFPYGAYHLQIITSGSSIVVKATDPSSVVRTISATDSDLATATKAALWMFTPLSTSSVDQADNWQATHP